MKSLSIWFSGIVVFFGLMQCADSRETRMQRHLVQGNEKIREQEYEQAERFFKEALRLDSCFEDALNNLGTVYHRRKNPEQALEYYSKALACEPRFLSALLNRANVSYEIGEYDQALADLNEVESLKPDTAVLWELRALVLWKRGEYEEARHAFARTGDPHEDPELMINLGTLFASEKQYDSGRYYLRNVLSIDPRNHLALNALAMLEADAGNVDEARKLLETALALAPRDPYYLNNRGYVYLLEGGGDQALPLINESITLDPYNGWAYRNKGYYYLKKGNIEEAIRLFERALNADARIDKLHLWMAEAQFRKGDQESGCHHLAEAAKLNQISEKEWQDKCR